MELTETCYKECLSHDKIRSLHQTLGRIPMPVVGIINTTELDLSGHPSLNGHHARHTRNRADDPTLIPPTPYRRRLSPHFGLCVLPLLGLAFNR